MGFLITFLLIACMYVIMCRGEREPLLKLKSVYWLAQFCKLLRLRTNYEDENYNNVIL